MKALDVTDAAAQKKWAVATGRRILAECDLEVWVKDQHVRKGISPMSSFVLGKAKRELGRAGIAGARNAKLVSSCCGGGAAVGGCA